MKQPVLIMAGGTGGHVFPALALARLLRASGREVVWLGTRRGLEARVVPEEGIAIEWLSVGGLRGKSVLTLMAAPFRLVYSLFQALRIMRRRRPSVVVGLGGFVTGPAGLAAWLCRRPLVIHEQNAIAGLTNRCLAPLAREVLCGFPGAFPERVHARVIGNPVRADIAALPVPALRFVGRQGPVRVLVIGGSLGATHLNTVVPQALARVQAEPGKGVQLTVRHQAGVRHLESTRFAYRRAGTTATITEFIGDMAEALGWADLAVCRAGALTVAELSAAGLGAVLVPYPHAVDDHQTFNAQFLVKEGAGLCIADHELTAQSLADQFILLGADRARLLAMAEAARRVAHPDAAAELLRSCLAVELP
jgi:UDP-N-acetylglucosamine--N-acetylmuramyl-(pentapeptide) pyrophosphoryl-undecaprenol N-acetylglucosamine transferase